MRRINAKKIAAVITGAALLGAGLAFAGQVTFQNVPIISNSGQPVVQIVVGSSAKPSDGVAAANIAAAIGNLAYTSTPITASVNATQARSVLGVSVSSAKYALANQQVWLNESGVTSATGGTYLFSALIGSVLNQGLELGGTQYTKSLQTSTNQYAFQETNSITASPLASPFTAAGFVPTSTSVVANSNGGGVSFSSFQTGSPSNDNILQVSSTQLSVLHSNFGGNGETEYLYVTGFPVYDQASGVNGFRLLNTGGAYQVIFNKPVPRYGSGKTSQINTPIWLLGTNYTIINETPPASGSVSSTIAIPGGSLYLASSLAPLQTVYVNSNISSGPWTVRLQDLGQPNSNGISPASVAVYYNNVLTNTTSVNPQTTARFNVSGHLMYLEVNQTFAGLYAYEKWAKLELYTSVWQISNGHVLNSTSNPGWYTDLLWTNTSGSSTPFSLYSIVIYNATPTTLAPGQSFSFIQSPSAYKVTFLGDTLGSGQFDSLTLNTQTASTLQYQNLGNGPTNITEPAQELIVASQIPNAFSYAGQTSSAVTYDLTPYELTEANVLTTTANAQQATNVILSYTNPGGQNPTNGNSQWINSTYPLLVQVQGYTTSSGGSPQSVNLQFTTANTASNVDTQTLPSGTSFYNITAINIQGGRALPVGSNGALTITVVNSNAGVSTGNVIGTLTAIAPGEIYQQTGKTYYSFSNSGSVLYNQQNGEPTTTFSLARTAVTSTGAQKYFTYTVSETAVPSNTAATDSLGIGIYNNTAGTQTTPMFILNYSTSGSHNNVTYTGTSGSSFNVQAGFRTEKGSKIATVSPTQDTFQLAEANDWLQFAVAPSTSNTTVSHSYSTHGPYTIGQATNLPNVSIANVAANITLSGASAYNITGINNINATPSVGSALVPVLLKNLTTAPLVVLDTNANTGSNLILIGSGYVNSLSGQLEKAYNITGDQSGTGTPVTQAYGTNRILIAGYWANQTTSAANNFINQLYAEASTS